MKALVNRLIRGARNSAENGIEDWTAERTYWEARLRHHCLQAYGLTLDPLQTDPALVPPRHLAAQIQGTDKADPDGFFASGHRTTLSYLTELIDNGFERQSMRRVLDLGVGLGRLILQQLPFESELHGCDVTVPVLQHAKSVLGHRAQFVVNGFEPPLPYPDDYFDFVYANSVFTHVPCSSLPGWAGELRRVVRVGGAVIVSILDANHYLRGRSHREFDSEFNQPSGAEWATDRGVQRMTYQSSASVRATWGSAFTILEVRPHYRDQTHVVCRRDH